MQRLRDNPSCADQEYDNIKDDLDHPDAGLSFHLSYDVKNQYTVPMVSSVLNYLRPTTKPRVAILRDQGTNGHAEMAFAFHSAGFTAFDVHMTDIMSGRVSLATFRGLALCGGFSFGDVLGAGQGWAKSILFHPPTREEFATFFKRPDTFTLGVCNGCQVLSKLKDLIPGAETWPSFERNESEQYEARVCMVGISDSPSPTPSTSTSTTSTTNPTSPNLLPPSVFLHQMSSSSLPIAVAHGEGRASFSPHPSTNATLAKEFIATGLAPIRYLHNTTLKPTQRYPYNPNGSPEAIAGVRSVDGRVLALMPHPERTVLGSAAGSYVPDHLRESFVEGGGAWGRLFGSVRGWCG